MNKAIIISLLILMPLVACKKEHTVKIIAKNAVTGEPYAGLAYAVKGTRTGNNGEKLVFVHEGFLDANGQATTTFKVNENLALNVGVTTPPNVCYKSSESKNGQSGAWNPKENANPTFQFEFAECGYLNFQMENVNCQGPNDQMYYRDRYSYQEWGDFDFPIPGCFVNLNSNFNAVPEGLRIFNWKVVRSGVTTEYFDSLYITAGQNSSIFLTY